MAAEVRERALATLHGPRGIGQRLIIAVQRSVAQARPTSEASRPQCRCRSLLPVAVGAVPVPEAEVSATSIFAPPQRASAIHELGLPCV